MKTIALLSFLAFSGYWTASSAVAHSTPTSTDSLFVLEDIGASPADSIFDDWKEHAGEIWKGKRAQRETLEEVISNLLHAYSQNGFPYAEISPRVEEAGEGKARLQLSIITGPAVYVSQLRASKFSAGEQKQLVRMLQFYPGYFDEREVETLKSRCRQFSELVWNGEPKLVESPDFSSTRLELPLSRRAKNRVEGGLGYLPSGSNNGVFGELNIQLITLGKIGREVDFSWNRPNYRTRSLAIRYQDFFLSPAAFYVFGNLGQEEREERFFRFSAKTGISALLVGGWKGGLGIDYGRITPREAIPPGAGVAARQYGLEIEVRKGEESFSESFYFSLALRMQYKKVFYREQVLTGTLKQVRLEAAKSIRISSTWRMYLKGKGEANLVPGFLFTRSDLYYLGGYGSVRGYPDESFLATRYLLGKVEPRLQVGNTCYLFGFFDLVNLSIGQNNVGLSISDRTKPSVGLGFSAGSGRMLLAFGWGEKVKIKDGIAYLRLSGEL